MLKGMFSKPENYRVYWKEYMHQCSEIGFGSLPIVIVISLFLGAVSTVQTAYQLVSPLIPMATVAQIVRDSMILELSTTVLSIVLAGVIGSKIASELGNMRISEQIDALEIMGINSKGFLVLPKILAGLTTIPLLIVISAVLGIWGGKMAGSYSGILSFDTYDIGLRQNLNYYNIQFAFYKAYTYSFIVCSVPAYFGYYVEGGSLEIGRASTNSVIASCILILIADYTLAAIFL